MEAQKPLYKEVIDKANELMLARCNLSLLSLVNVDTLAAYEASIVATNTIFVRAKQHENNKKGRHGFNFEAESVGWKNIKNAMISDESKFYTTDDLKLIKQAQAGELNPKQLAYVMQNFPDEVNNLDFNNSKLKDLAKTNHNSVDVININKNGKVAYTAQYKAIKNTRDLLKDRYLDCDEIVVSSDDYPLHKQKLEKIIAKGGPDSTKAKKALEKLKQDDINRTASKNPRISAVTAQCAVATTHIVQAGLSESLLSSISVIASGIVYEVKSAIERSEQIGIKERLRRLFKAVWSAFKSSFLRGAGFAFLETLIGLGAQIFKKVSKKIFDILKAIRNSAKSIYNSVYSYITSKDQTFSHLIANIFKGIAGGLGVIGAVVLEANIEAVLFPYLGPVASIVAIVLSIGATSLAMVYACRSIDTILNSFFTLEASRIRAENLAKLCETELPKMIKDRKFVEALMEVECNKRTEHFNHSFADYKNASINGNVDGTYCALNDICKLYGRELNIRTTDDALEKLKEPNRTGKLKY